MSKSLERLKRLAKRKGIRGTVSFDPYRVQAVDRYTLHTPNKYDGSDDVPLGFNAQAARFALNHMKEG